MKSTWPCSIYFEKVAWTAYPGFPVKPGDKVTKTTSLHLCCAKTLLGLNEWYSHELFMWMPTYALDNFFLVKGHFRKPCLLTLHVSQKKENRDFFRLSFLCSYAAKKHFTGRQRDCPIPIQLKSLKSGVMIS